MTSLLRAPKIVVLGMLTKHPVGGVVWQVAQYLIGLQRLGFDVYYVEAHGMNPSMLMSSADDDGSALASAYIDRAMRRWGLKDRWAFHAVHDDGSCYGMSKEALLALYADADLIINLHGGTLPRPEHVATGRLVYLGTDPVQVELEAARGEQETLSYLEAHCAYFTFGLNYGTADCGLPYLDRFPMVPTVQPVLLDAWYDEGRPAGDRFTTVGNWRQKLRDVEYQGQTLTWSKHHEFLKIIDLPRRVGVTLELALSSIGDADRELLERHGWRLRSGAEVSKDPDDYLGYIAGSRGEISVAKEQNVRLRTGWFSDRSASYLAAGRPVIVQDTAFGSALPTGEGLLAFSSVEQAAACVEEVEGRYALHARAARDIARSYFDSDVVLGSMLRHLGVAVPARRARRFGVCDHAWGNGLRLEPVTRRPMRLTAETVEEVLTQPLATAPTLHGRPRASIVMVTFGQLLFTRMALETVLAVTEPPYEVIVVDNASTDGTADYLTAMAALNPHVRVVLNDRNVGFAAANNQGLELARAPHLVLLNNDTLVTRGWLAGLLRRLDDPGVGLVGPVTNRICNEAQVPVDYLDYGGLVSFARRRASVQAGDQFEIPVVTMFCLAMRRSTYEELGPLDEGFGIGTLEDDDYSRRARERGLRTICVEDVFVHHFSQATFSALVTSGDYGDLQLRNRDRFEHKWGTWIPYERRVTAEYESVRRQVIASALEGTSPGAVVAIATHGDEALLLLPGRDAWHFPRMADGAYAGHYPASGAEATELLVQAIAAGATHLVLPSWAEWWLDHYTELADYLAAAPRQDFAACSVFTLQRALSGLVGPAVVDVRWDRKESRT